MVFALLPLLAGAKTAPSFEFDLKSGEGLSLRASGVPIVMSSGLQYYEPGWIKGYYGTTFSSQTVEHPDPDTAIMTFSGAEGRATGSERVHREGDRCVAHYHLEWSGDHAVQVELTAGLIWAPALQAGALMADAHSTRALTAKAYKPDQNMDARRYAPDSRAFNFQAPIGAVEMSSTVPVTLFDARGYHQEYAAGKSVWWCGALGIGISKGGPIDLDVVWTIRPNPEPEPRSETHKLVSQAISNATAPEAGVAPLIPKPRKADLDYDKPVAMTNLFSFPAGRPRYWDLFKEMLSRRFDVPAPAKSAVSLKVDGGVSRMHITPGGYTIDITPNSISVLGEEEEGLRNGMYRLAQLAFVRAGRLWFPTGHIADEPRSAWRGVHLFGGPEARAFQRRLWDRVLLPLGMNKAVIQCERAGWQSTPLDPSTHPMSLSDLSGLFDDYRKVGVDPIPLIQSLGHMEWFFDGKRRLDLAMNPAEPYTIDPRKKGTKPAIEALWNEAIDLLKPSAIHFGCDEIDMVGMSPHNPELTTDIWRSQMATLGGIARKHAVSMMIWGDEALGPGEAIDATNGDSKEEAANRRASIPEGATICDWHYASDPEPFKYYKTLQLWKREGLHPIASTYFEPENIRGFDQAAALEHVGTLQTTWAGYESSEAGMIENSPTFVALVTAADYAWSARQDAPDKVGYDPATIFREMYFGVPSPVAPRPGISFSWSPAGRSVQVGTSTFRVGTPIAFRSVLTTEGAQGPTSVVLDTDAVGKISHLTVAFDTTEAASEGEPVAEVAVVLATGETITRRLAYGHHVRSASDHRLTPYAERGEGICAVRIDLPHPSALRKVTIQAAGNLAGLRLYGVTGG